jgi:hypothetical protein
MPRARGTLYPYATLLHRLTLEFDKESLPETVTISSERTLNASDHEGVFPIELRLPEISKPEWAKQLKISLEELDGAVRVVVVERSTTARVRRELTTWAVGEFEQPRSINLDPDDYRGKLEIQAFLIYRDNHGTGLANCRCGESEALNIYFDDYDMLPGSDIPSRWVNFTDPARGLTDRADQLFVVKADSEPPELLLNSAIDNFKLVMSTGAQHGPKQRIRDAICHRIACQTWQAILNDTLARLSSSVRTAEGVNTNEVLDQLSPWRKNLIISFAGDKPSDPSFPNVTKLIEDLEREPDRIQVEDATNWVQQHLLKREPFEDLAKFLEE